VITVSGAVILALLRTDVATAGTAPSDTERWCVALISLPAVIRSGADGRGALRGPRIVPSHG
jgi:hypothetical protein